MLPKLLQTQVKSVFLDNLTLIVTFHSKVKQFKSLRNVLRHLNCLYCHMILQSNLQKRSIPIREAAATEKNAPKNLQPRIDPSDLRNRFRFRSISDQS